MIGPVEPSMTASQAMAGLPPAMLTPVQAAAWLQDSRDGFEDAGRLAAGVRSCILLAKSKT